MVMRQAPPGLRLFPELLPHRSEPPTELLAVTRTRICNICLTTYETEVVPEPHFASTVTCRGMPLLR